MATEFEGKRVLITGGRRGIGLAAAKAFLAEGTKVAICARSKDAVDETVATLAGTWPGQIIGGEVNVRDTASVRQFVEQVAVTWGGVDILLNNAGESHSGTIDDSEPEEVLNQGNILQYGHYRMAQAVIPHMREQRWGRIIGVNAIVGHVPSPGGIGSNMNRAACIALSKSLAIYLAPDNILVNTVNLGFLESDLWDRHYDRLAAPMVTREAFRKTISDFVPLGRLGTPEEVVGAILFLASEQASFVTGASIDISGGLFGQLAYFPRLLRQMNEAGC